MKRSLFAAFVVMLMSVTAAFAEEMAPMSVTGATTVDVAKAKELYDKGALFVDPRKDSDWDAGRIAGAEHLELKSAMSEDSLSKLAKKNEPLVFYCNGVKCKVSSSACEKAVSWGFKNVYYFREGFPAWKSAGYPVE